MATLHQVICFPIAWVDHGLSSHCASYNVRRHVTRYASSLIAWQTIEIETLADKTEQTWDSDLRSNL